MKRFFVYRYPGRPIQVLRVAGLGIILLMLPSMATAGVAPTPFVDWSNSFLLQGTGFENPLVRVGFNPQPDPPFPPDLFLDDPTRPRLTVPTGGISTFQILFAISDTGPLSIRAGVPPISVPDPSGHFEFQVLNPSGDAVFDVFFDMTTSSGGVPDRSSWVGFNPQPDPPGLPAGAGAIGFDFALYEPVGSDFDFPGP